MDSKLEQAPVRRRSITDLGYRVRIFPAPVVIDEQGRSVADAFVVSIRLPRETTDTLAGRVAAVTGADVAKILVRGTAIRRVPLC